MYLGLSGANVDLLHSVGHEKKKKKKEYIELYQKVQRQLRGIKGCLRLCNCN